MLKFSGKLALIGGFLLSGLWVSLLTLGTVIKFTNLYVPYEYGEQIKDILHWGTQTPLLVLIAYGFWRLLEATFPPPEYDE